MQKPLISEFQCGRLGPGKHRIAENLYLQITENKEGNDYRSWLFRFVSPETGKERFMGLGSFRNNQIRWGEVTLREALQAADAARALIRQGIDPLAERERGKEKQSASRKLEEARAMSFNACAAAYVKAHSAGWRSKKHEMQWGNTLRDYASPVFGTLPVAAIDTPLILRALEPIWKEKSVTAGRVRARIEVVLDWATARGYRDETMNPASWKKLRHLLPAHRKLAAVAHHPAIPYPELPALMQKLLQQDTIIAHALRFLILTAARAGEVIGAKWSEIEGDIWVIPASRMKMHRPSVPMMMRQTPAGSLPLGA